MGVLFNCISVNNKGLYSPKPFQLLLPLENIQKTTLDAYISIKYCGNVSTNFI